MQEEEKETNKETARGLREAESNQSILLQRPFVEEKVDSRMRFSVIHVE